MGGGGGERGDIPPPTVPSYFAGIELMGLNILIIMFKWDTGETREQYSR
jgi:hypothetical protein